MLSILDGLPSCLSEEGNSEDPNGTIACYTWLMDYSRSISKR